MFLTWLCFSRCDELGIFFQRPRFYTLGFTQHSFCRTSTFRCTLLNILTDCLSTKIKKKKTISERFVARFRIFLVHCQRALLSFRGLFSRLTLLYSLTSSFFLGTNRWGHLHVHQWDCCPRFLAEFLKFCHLKLCKYAHNCSQQRESCVNCRFS